MGTSVTIPAYAELTPTETGLPSEFSLETRREAEILLSRSAVGNRLAAADRAATIIAIVRSSNARG